MRNKSHRNYKKITFFIKIYKNVFTCPKKWFILTLCTRLVKKGGICNENRSSKQQTRKCIYKHMLGS